MNPNNETEELLLTGLILGGLTLINKIINFFIKKGLKGSSNAFAAGIQVYDYMNDIINNTPAQRVIIFKAVNGGQKIKLGSHLNINSVQGISKPPFNSDDWKRYRGLTVDEDYNRMLLEVSTNKIKKITVDINDPNANSMLMNIYKASGVLYSEIHHVFDHKKEYYFISISTDQQITFDDNPVWRATIDLNVSKINKIYSKNLN
jgi:hypothetical protein